MTLSYPLTVPSSPAPTKLKFAPRFAIGQSESPFTFQGEFFEHMGQQWVMEVSLPPMRKNDAENWISWGLALNGTMGTFYMGDSSNSMPRGSAAGTPQVNGAGQQRSKTLATKGWTPSTAVLRIGDYIQLGYRLHKVLQDVTSDSSGEAVLDIFPRVRDVLTNGQAIITANPVGTWRLKAGIEWDVAGAMKFGIGFTAMEDV